MLQRGSGSLDGRDPNRNPHWFTLLCWSPIVLFIREFRRLQKARTARQQQALGYDEKLPAR